MSTAVERDPLLSNSQQRTSNSFPEVAVLSEDTKPFAGSNVGEILLLLISPHPHGMGLGANGVAPEDRVRERFLRIGDWEEADYEPATQKAIEEGWVERISGRVRLTKEGRDICK
jgi:hypothetical protein